MRIDYSILVKDGKKPADVLDIDLNILSFNSKGKEYNVDMVGWVDVWREENYIKGTLKSDRLEDVYDNKITADEIEEAFKTAENIIFGCRFYQEVDTDSELVSWEADVQICDTIKKCSGSYL